MEDIFWAGTGKAWDGEVPSEGREEFAACDLARLRTTHGTIRMSDCHINLQVGLSPALCVIMTKDDE